MVPRLLAASPVIALACISSLPAQDTLSASLVALAPIVASGPGGAPVSQPAGPLTSAHVVGPSGTTLARFSCDLTSNPSLCELAANSAVGVAFGGPSSTTTDLLLTVASTVPATTVSVEIEVTHFGDFPSPQGFQVDIGNDGVHEVDVTSIACCGTTRRHHATTSFVTGPLLVRVRHDNTCTASAQGYSLSVRVREWLAGAVPVAPQCSVLATSATTTSEIYYTNYQMGVFPPVTSGIAELRAAGFGDLQVFVVSDSAAAVPLQLPAPYTGVCDVPVNVLAFVAGEATGSGWTGTSPQSTAWRFTVPVLPTGLVLYVQHLSASFGAPFCFGASNLVRFDT